MTFRVGVAALLLLVPAAAVDARPLAPAAQHACRLVAYGTFAVAGAQLFYFSAIQHLSVGVALLIEYLAPVLIVGWLWARHGRRPTRLTVLGVALSLGGLALVLDLTGEVRIDPVGVVFALLAALGLAVYFLLADHDEGTEPLPPVALAGGGLLVGFVALVLAGVTRLLPSGGPRSPTSSSAARRCRGGCPRSSWRWSPVRSPTCSASRRCAGCARPSPRSWRSPRWSSRCCSPGGCSASCPTLVQLLGGVLIVGGVVAVRLGDARRPAPGQRSVRQRAGADAAA